MLDAFEHRTTNLTTLDDIGFRSFDRRDRQELANRAVVIVRWYGWSFARFAMPIIIMGMVAFGLCRTRRVRFRSYFGVSSGVRMPMEMAVRRGGDSPDRCLHNGQTNCHDSEKCTRHWHDWEKVEIDASILRLHPVTSLMFAGNKKFSNQKLPEMASERNQQIVSMPNRREAIFQFGAGIGAIALALLDRPVAGSDASARENYADPPRPHHPPKAKNCIFLMMEGGPSHIDTFDPKPRLEQLHLQEFTRNDRMQSAMSGGKRYYVASPFRFHKVGENGADMATNWEHLQSAADDICFFRGCQVDSVNHPTAMFQMNTGNRFSGDPALGAWVTYGLGSSNQDVPGFLVMPEVSYPQGGTANWSNGFLPPTFQGTPLRSSGSPLLDLKPPDWVSREHQRKNLDLLKKLNDEHAKSRSGQSQLAARTANYELAFRMQLEVPGILDLHGETQTTMAQYGIGQEPTNSFGQKCLLARRLVERGVRFVQLYAGTWDSHDYIERAHGNLVRTVDRPIAGLLLDLKQRGLLDETLVVWCGEFGRSPDNGVRQGTAFGRDHNPKGMAVWLAGGGVMPGIVGATDELGGEAVECVHHVRDLHVTLLHLMGLDDSRLTFYHAGRWKQLSQFGGQVISEITG